MAEDRMALLETLRKATADGDTDFLREGVRVLAQAVMEAEVTELTGAARGERNPDARLTHRNGYRDRRWDTRVGTIDLLRVFEQNPKWTKAKSELEKMQDAFKAQITDRTKLVAIGYASNAVGTINPVAEIARRAHAVGAWVFVDAVHYAPHGPLDAAALGADFLACSAYKLFGPHVGILWGRAEILDSLPAYKVRPASDHWETGTQNHEGIAGTRAALEEYIVAAKAAIRSRLWGDGFLGGNCITLDVGPTVAGWSVIGGAIWASHDDAFYFSATNHAGYAWHHGFWGLIDYWRRPKPEWWKPRARSVKPTKKWSPLRSLSQRRS